MRAQTIAKRATSAEPTINIEGNAVPVSQAYNVLLDELGRILARLIVSDPDAARRMLGVTKPESKARKERRKKARKVKVASNPRPHTKLTARETEALQLIRTGKPDEEVAAAMGIATRSVSVWKAKLRNKGALPRAARKPANGVAAHA